MSSKLFSVMAAALAVVVAAIFLLLPAQTARDGVGTAGELLPGFSENVNEVDRIVAVGAGGNVVATVQRDEQGWSVAELSDYPADLDTVRTVLASLAQAQLIENKTSNPDYYSRLGVEDVSLADASGIRLDLSAGDQDWSLIIGNEAPDRGGFYLRQADAEGSVLADFDEDVPGDASGWVDSRVIDILAGEVAEVQIMHPNGETVTARKVSADESDFTLMELPEGRELVSAWSINSLGSALSTLDFEAVEVFAAGGEHDWAQAVEIRTVLFSGLTVDAQLLREEGGDFLKLHASAPYPEAEDEENTELIAAVDEINQRVEGWVYEIPASKAEALVKRLEDLLREPDSASGDS